MQSKRFADNSIVPCSCDWVQDRLFGYLDGELSLPERERFQAHTETCSACAREIQNSRRADLALHQAVRAIPAAGDLRSGFYAKLAQSEARWHPSRRWGWALAVPAFAAGLLAFVLMQPSTTDLNSDPSQLAKNSVAIAPPISKQQDTAASIINESAPSLAPAKNAPLREVNLSLADAELPIRVTKQEIQRAGKSVVVRAEVPPQVLYRANFPLATRDAGRVLFDSNNRFAESKSSSHHTPQSLADSPLLRQEAAPKSKEESRAFASTMVTDDNEQRQNVMRVASFEQTETDGESYLEVDDDTRNFSFSTRLASSQENGEEQFELSVSGDEPESAPDGAGVK